MILLGELHHDCVAHVLIANLAARLRSDAVVFQEMIDLFDRLALRYEIANLLRSVIVLHRSGTERIDFSVSCSVLVGHDLIFLSVDEMNV